MGKDLIWENVFVIGFDDGRGYMINYFKMYYSLSERVKIKSVFK